MDSGRLMGAGRLIEVKSIEKTSSGLDYWSPNKGGRLIGGRLIAVELYYNALFSNFCRISAPFSITFSSRSGRGRLREEVAYKRFQT